MSFRHEARRSEQTLIVVADRGQARFFAGLWPDLDPWEEQVAFVNPESHVRMHETVTDAPGRFRTPTGQTAATDPKTDFRHQTTASFARRLIERLEEGRNQNQFGRLVVVAPALLLGELRRETPAPLARLVTSEIERDLVRLSSREIRERVQEALASQGASPG